MTSAHLHVQELSQEECRRILGRNRIGRLAFTFRDRVDIRPLSFVSDGDWIFGRTASGEKLVTLEHHRWVAFQVDEVEDDRNWVSVLVHGAFHLLQEEGSQEARRIRKKAMNLIRKGNPRAFTEEDTVPERQFIFGIAIQEVTGRRAKEVSSTD